MKKKFIALLLATSMALTLSACGESSDSTAKSERKTTEKKTESDVNDSQPKEASVKKDLPDGDYQDTGSGSIILNTAGGTTENGNIPVIFVSSDKLLTQIEIDSSGFDETKLSYIYIDGILTTKEQLSDSQATFDLTDQALSVGTHLVEVLQYDGDSPENAYTTYKSASYEIKEK